MSKFPFNNSETISDRIKERGMRYYHKNQMYFIFYDSVSERYFVEIYVDGNNEVSTSFSDFDDLASSIFIYTIIFEIKE